MGQAQIETFDKQPDALIIGQNLLGGETVTVHSRENTILAQGLNLGLGRILGDVAECKSGRSSQHSGGQHNNGNSFG
ncbi:hypothetical protein D3C75_989380 [compost metagenome]